MLANILLFALLFAGGCYCAMLGFGLKLRPLAWRGKEETAWLGRILIFLSLFIVPSFFGLSLTDVREALEDIWTSGGGKGTG